MLKYVLIVVLNTPFVILGMIRGVRAYQQELIGRSRLIALLLFWTIVLIGILTAAPLYDYLRAHGLTDSPPLSVFDIVIVTGLVTSFFLHFRMYFKVDILERRLIQLNKETSLALKKR